MLDEARTIFVDRDGVINRKARGNRYVLSPGDLVLLPGAAEALALLSASNRRVIIVTNQRGVARGVLTREALQGIHAALQDMLAARGARIAGIYTCVHEAGTCMCRKPLPGLLLAAQHDHPSIDFGHSVVVGDSARDVQAGAAVGCGTVLIGRGHRRSRELAALHDAGYAPVATAGSLLAATRRFLLTREIGVLRRRSF
jgi:D-glycero-D-manno-heptose 1,7-bisphosphate phosphatase